MAFDPDLRDLIKATEKATQFLGQGIEAQRMKLRMKRDMQEAHTHNVHDTGLPVNGTTIQGKPTA